MGYPIWDLAMGGGVLMGVVAVAHVIVAHFAIGGGLLLAVSETLSIRRGDWELRELARRSSLMLILVSTVFGAVSGVGIWVVAGLISPGAISALIHNYVWGWAIEWTFFLVEIVAALVYYTTWGRISRGAHVMVGWVYFGAAFLSLVVINGIITFMLTPGRWLETQAFWDGFFNPTYWPSLVLRTGICAMLAAAFMLFPARRAADAEARSRLTRYLGWWLVGGVLVAYGGYRWWEAALPEPVAAIFRGESPLLPALAETRSLTLWALTAVLVLAVVLMVAMPKAARMGVAAVVMVATFTFFGGYERLREGVRKPFLIHSHMFSNGLLIQDIEDVNARGMGAVSGWVGLAMEEDGVIGHGRAVFQAQCASCHTRDGYQAIRPLLPTVDDVLRVAADDPEGSGAEAYRAECASCHPDIGFEDMRSFLPTPGDIREDPEMIRGLNRGMIAATLEELRDMGDLYTEAEPGVVIDTREAASPVMPPMVGSDDDLEALADHLAGLDTGPGAETPGSEGGV